MTTEAVQRLAASLADNFPRGWLRGRFNSPAFEQAVEQMFAADPALAEALETGLALEAAEAAFEGQIEFNRRVSPDGPDDLYAARAYSRGSEFLAVGLGPTIAAAARSLAVRLKEVQGGN